MRKVWIGVLVGAAGGAALGLLRDSAHRGEHDCDETGCEETSEPDSGCGPAEETRQVRDTVVPFAF